MDRGTVVHQIEPVWSSDSRVLVLGTMPSPASRNAGFFYMHPQNRFWRVLPAAFGDALSFPNNADDRAAAVRERREFLLRHGIAL
ncbi:MAG: DNA-deoxyinosine glycosylase, partial [Treponema sp.]|nr:DNA-deoxyinosine glycosylase [Treponema sp.]